MIYREFVRPPQTINQIFFRQVITRFDIACQNRRPRGMVAGCHFIHMDNASSHTAALTCLHLNNLGWTILPHPPTHLIWHQTIFGFILVSRKVSGGGGSPPLRNWRTLWMNRLATSRLQSTDSACCRNGLPDGQNVSPNKDIILKEFFDIVLTVTGMLLFMCTSLLPIKQVRHCSPAGAKWFLC